MVYMILGNGFEETEAVAPLDCLRRAGVAVTTLGIGGRQITSAHGIPVLADQLLTSNVGAYPDLEMLILPGGMGGVHAIQGSAAAEGLISCAAEKGAYLAAICAGPTILGAEGLLKGKQAVCYPGMEEGLVEALPQVGRPVVVDGKIVTAEAAGSAMAFGLKLVEVLKGRPLAEKVAHEVHYHGEF